MDRVLGVFAKEPKAGTVKSRLAVSIGADSAAQVYDAFLRDFLLKLESIPVRRVLVYTPDTAFSFFAGLANERFELESQANSDLGSRMAAFFAKRFQQGAGEVVLVGSDAPHLSRHCIEQAFELLDRSEAVLGPCEDGGYYLLGLNREIPDLFESMEWSTAGVLTETVRRLESLGIKPTLLDELFDVDRIVDLNRLRDFIHSERAARRDPCLPHTERAIRGMTS